jgi:hypothetical protein
MVFTDPPANVNAGFAPINDLDLEVVDPNGNTYLGNVFSGGESVTGGATDIRNNVEQVHLSAPPSGGWTLRIRGTAVNVGTQGYSVVISGDVSDQGGGGGEIADITDFEVVFGTHVGGGVTRLETSDDMYLRTRSAFGLTALEPNLMEIVIGFATTVENAESFNATIESRLNNPGGLARVRLRNWNTNLFEEVGAFDTNTTDTVEQIGGIAAADRVDGSGRIEMSIKNIVVATFSLAGFDTYFDHVRLVVN